MMEAGHSFRPGVLRLGIGVVLCWGFWLPTSVDGTVYRGREAAEMLLTRQRKMSHCRRCRLDAVGLLQSDGSVSIDVVNDWPVF
jgi:hypothetical protein